ncbi:hypothetical protein GCM10009096_23490 [Parasphingorhabdus litoris]|uniref:Flagellar motor switch protein FliN-like C-terminal domain-containing protein n=1 Tax=Parasphingorhabdus litoris TaxID=394733 RepID=A0ABP3KIT8_9SPHN|nr:FliM/FliN family flagellar motor switch protein [Parasphingorhabdus litoris]
MSHFMFGQDRKPETSASEEESQLQRPATLAEEQPEAAAHALRDIDPAPKAFANRLSALFSALPTSEVEGHKGGLPTSSKIMESLPSPSNPPVFSDNAGRYFQPLATDHGPVHVHQDDLDTLVELLDRFEPLLQMFERRSGHAIEPAALANEWPAQTLWIELTGSENCTARFGFAPQLQHVENLPQPSMIADLNGIPVLVELILRGASLALSAADRLASGDLFLLDSGVLAAKLIADPEYSGQPQEIDGLWDRQSGLFQTGTGQRDNRHPPSDDQQGTTSMADDISPNPTSENPGSATRSFEVPIHICLRNITVTADKLASLAEGTTLDLMPLREGLQVDLSIAGQAIGSGEIVKLGTNFAVLMDNVAATNPSPGFATAKDEAVSPTGTSSKPKTTPTGESA